MPQWVDTPYVEVVVVATSYRAVEKILYYILYRDRDIDHEVECDVFIGVEVALNGGALRAGPVKGAVGRVVRNGQRADLNASLAKAETSESTPRV